MTRILRIAVLVPLFLTALTPLIIWPWLPFPFISGKAYYFRLLLDVALLPWVALLALRQISVPWSRPLIMLAVAVGVMLVADLNADYPSYAFLSNVERMDGFVNLAFLSLFALIAASMLSTERLRVAYLWSLIGGSLAMMPLVGLQWWINLQQPIGTLGNASYVGQFFAMMAFLALSLVKEVMPHRPGTTAVPNHYKFPPPATILALGAAFLSVLAVFASGSRGALLALTAGSIVYWWTSQGALTWKLALGCLAALGASFLLYLDQPLWQRILVLGTWDNRPEVWGKALELAQMHPLLGWGHDHFRYAYNHVCEHYCGQVDRAHNLVLDWLVQGGLVGLYAWAGFILAIRREASEKPYGRMAIYAFLAAYVASDATLFDTLPTYLLVFSVAALCSTRQSAAITQHDPLGLDDCREHPSGRIYLDA